MILPTVALNHESLEFVRSSLVGCCIMDFLHSFNITAVLTQQNKGRENCIKGHTDCLAAVLGLTPKVEPTRVGHAACMEYFGSA